MWSGYLIEESSLQLPHIRQDTGAQESILVFKQNWIPIYIYVCVCVYKIYIIFLAFRWKIKIAETVQDGCFK